MQEGWIELYIHLDTMTVRDAIGQDFYKSILFPLMQLSRGEQKFQSLYSNFNEDCELARIWLG